MHYHSLVIIVYLLLSNLAHAAEPAGQFVPEQSCAQCHQQQYQQWSDSHHAQAMQEATEDTVLGDFNNTEFKHFGESTRFFKENNNFMVNTSGPDGKPQDYKVHYTFGVEPLQQYLLEMPDGRLQALTVAWDSRSKDQGGQRWFHLFPNEKISPDEPLHWTGRYHNWNGMCAECHSTNLEKRYDPVTDNYQTTMSGINVGCQACHGPGSNHVAWAQGKGKADETSTRQNKGLLIPFQQASSDYQIEQCARCHARRRQVSTDDAHGRALLDDFMPATLRQGLYHPDGQILDEVYVYGSFLQSKMYQAGVRCTDCHNPHTAGLKITSKPNAICTQCHNPAGNLQQRFAQLQAKQYDSAEHHFHPIDSAGAQCVNCHMPANTYMVLDDRRDHSFRIPRPDLSIKLGTPNACTQCHDDKTAAWAAEQITTWYGPKQNRETHYGEIFAATWADQPNSQAALEALLKQTRQPPIVRATAAELLRPSDPQTFQALLDAAYDDEPLLRGAAISAFAGLPEQYLQKAVAPLLEDPIRAVRTEAARVLAATSIDKLNPAKQAQWQAALQEYRDAQLASSDVLPGSHLNLAVLESNLGNVKQAEQHYRKAIKIDPDFLPARVNLANLYNAQQRNQEAEQVLRDAIARVPEEGELYYSLGLLLAEEQRLADAADALGQAARLLPNRARVQYNYALALQHLGRLGDAEQALLNTHGLAPGNPDFLQALVIFYTQQKRWDDAYPYAEQLVRLYPNAAEARRTLEQIKALKQYGVKE